MKKFPNMKVKIFAPENMENICALCVFERGTVEKHHKKQRFSADVFSVVPETAIPSTSLLTDRKDRRPAVFFVPFPRLLINLQSVS